MIRSLRLVEADVRGVERISFCGHCGRPPEHSAAAPASRVCGDCGLGLVLSAASDIAPRPQDPFLVIDATLSICALSATAEKLLGTTETDAVNRHVTDFLVPAAAEERSANLLALLVDAASSDEEPRTAVVRPAQEFGVRFQARVGACGPPHAALVVLTG